MSVSKLQYLKLLMDLATLRGSEHESHLQEEGGGAVFPQHQDAQRPDVESSGLSQRAGWELKGKDVLTGDSLLLSAKSLTLPLPVLTSCTRHLP